MRKRITPLTPYPFAHTLIGTMTGNPIKSARTQLGWTQRQLAEAMGVKQNTVSRWENGVLRIRPRDEQTARLVLRAYASDAASAKEAP
jgi:transcriptional regulator with XRE-family HTH domain